MSINWFNEQPKEIIVTISATNLTINKPGIQFFEKAHQVMLGYDQQRHLILIKPLTKDEAIRGDIPEHSRYNISISTSYARITNKSFIQTVLQVFNLTLDPKGTKFSSVFNNQSQLLEINLKGVI